MKLKDYLDAADIKQGEIADDIGCDPSFISRLCTNDKPLPRAAAIKVYRKRGVKLDPIANATDEEIAVLERFESERAA